MTDSEFTGASTDLLGLADELLEKARAGKNGRSAQQVYAGPYLKHVVMALTAGTELAEHDSPPEATLAVLAGSIDLRSADDAWKLGRGQFMQIPPARHSVLAHEDSAFILTVRLDVSKA